MTTPIAVDHIVAGVIEDVAAREAQVSFKEVKARSRSGALPAPRDGVAALLRTGCSLVPELKRAVPYGGEIARLDTPASMAALACELEEAGVHVMACQHERSDDADRLVGGDPPGDPYDDVHSSSVPARDVTAVTRGRRPASGRACPR